MGEAGGDVGGWDKKLTFVTGCPLGLEAFFGWFSVVGRVLEYLFHKSWELVYLVLARAGMTFSYTVIIILICICSISWFSREEDSRNSATQQDLWLRLSSGGGEMSSPESVTRTGCLECNLRTK